jgi:hypothetical protein
LSCQSSELAGTFISKTQRKTRPNDCCLLSPQPACFWRRRDFAGVPYWTRSARRASSRKLCVLAYMQATIDKSAFFTGVWLALPVIYLFLGMFSDARWLQPTWGRKFGRPAVVPLSRLSRLLWLLFIGIFAARSFARACHYDVNRLTGIALPALMVIFVCMILSGIRDGRNFKGKHDPDV